MSYFFLGSCLGYAKELVVVGELGHAGQGEKSFTILHYDVTEYISYQVECSGGRRGRSNASAPTSATSTRGALICRLPTRFASDNLRVRNGTIVLLGRRAGMEVADVPSNKGFSVALDSWNLTVADGSDALRAGHILMAGGLPRSLATDGRSMGLSCVMGCFWSLISEGGLSSGLASSTSQLLVTTTSADAVP